jgi:hypothetical protein
MIFKTRPGIKKQFEMLHDFKIKNLIVSGCSFTYNNHETAAVTWPYYLRDIGGFEQVLDTSMPGAGNYHIASSLTWALEINQPDPDDSLVLIMWSGNDRDDYLTPVSNLNGYPFEFKYSDDVASAITGGAHPDNMGNTLRSPKDFVSIKTPECKAIENYLYILNTWSYLKNAGYKFLFMDFTTADFPIRSNHFAIEKYLPAKIKKHLRDMKTELIDPYQFSLKNDLLCIDDFHPNPTGHLAWTRQQLLPKLIQIFD